MRPVRRYQESLEIAIRVIADSPRRPPAELLQHVEDSDAISPASRAVLLLHFKEDLTLPEVAAVLDLPLGTVKSRLSYGLATLRKHFNRRRSL